MHMINAAQLNLGKLLWELSAMLLCCIQLPTYHQTSKTPQYVYFIVPYSEVILHVTGILHAPSGLQLRKSEQYGFHNKFLISQPNPMM